MEKSTLMAGIAGGVVMFLLGWLFYGMSGVMDSHVTEVGKAASLSDEDMNIALIAIANLITGIIMAHLYSKWARGSHGFGHGAKFGAAIGALIGVGLGLIYMATSAWMTSTGYIIDGVWQIVMYALTGGVIGMVMGKSDGGD